MNVTVWVDEADLEYLRAFVHLRKAEELLYEGAPEAETPRLTAVYDFLPPELETRVVEAVAEAVENASAL